MQNIEEHPTPPFVIDSPVVKYLLHSWTTNTRERELLDVWLKHLSSNRSLKLSTFNPVMILKNIPAEIRDGFLTMVIPLLRRRKDILIEVYIRNRENDFSDLKMICKECN